MLLNKRTLMVFNVEYEMPGADGKPETWKANVVCKGKHEDAVDFIRKYTGKAITVLSIGKITDIDAISDAAIGYIMEKSAQKK